MADLDARRDPSACRPPCVRVLLSCGGVLWWSCAEETHSSRDRKGEQAVGPHPAKYAELWMWRAWLQRLVKKMDNVYKKT